MPKKERNYLLTPELLSQYRDAALANAESLLQEADLLLENGHQARAYFLAVSCIEEVGKAVQAYEALGKNLKDSAIQQRLKLLFEDHSQKITYAFMPWLNATKKDLRDRVMEFTEIMVDIQFGREAAMYTDINADRAAVITPEMQVRQKAAIDCTRLARAVLKHARPYAEQAQPKIATREQDALFAMKPSQYQKIVKSVDFWWYHISRIEQGQQAFDANVVEYNRKYFARSVLFKVAATAGSLKNGA
jgi:AbiV family abortive infection protein